MSGFDGMGWQDKWDELELRADPALMPLVISLRSDMELFAAAALQFTEMGALALKQRQQILDAAAVAQEWAE